MQTPGEYSDPFESRIGWHIIRLENKIPVPSFEEMEPTLKRRINRDERLQIGQEAELARRKQEFGIVENKELIDMLLQKADTSLQKGKWVILALEPRKDDTLFISSTDASRMKNFYAFVRSKQKPTALPPQTYLRQLYSQYMEERIGALEDRKLQKESPEYRNLLNEYREGILLFSIMEKEVWNKASEDTVGQKHYYEANTAKYAAGERVYARILGTTDPDLLEEIKQMIQNGDTLKAPDLRRLKIVTSFRGYQKGDHKAIDSIAWSVGLHQAQSEGMHYLVEVERLIPAGIMTFAEARASVISDYQDSLEKSWIEQLKKQHIIKIDKKSVKAVIASLEKK